MFWLYNDFDEYVFYQLFYNFDKTDIDDNIIYKLDINTELNVKDLKYIEIDYEIKIKDHFIMYRNINNNEEIAFEINIKFYNENDNIYDIPIIYNKYKKILNTQFPYLTYNMYDKFYPKLNFKIYQITDELLYIIEHNENSSTRKYILNMNENNEIKKKLLDKFTDNHKCNS